jgi:hypothetical protein
MAKRTFEQALDAFVKSGKAMMNAARECAEISITQFSEHGDLSKAQQFMDAMHKNYNRKDAFLRWLVTYAPVKLEGGKLKKDQSREDVVNLEAALAKDFWDFKPQLEDINFTAADVFSAVERALKRLHKDNVKAADDKASEQLILVEDFIKSAKEEAGIAA